MAACLAFATSAFAGSFYVDVAGGVSQIHSADSFFGPGSDNSSHLGLATDIGLLANFARGSSPTELQFGLLTRTNLSSSPGGNAYGILTVYPALRLQISRAFFGGGITPLVYSGPSLFSFRAETAPALAYFGEAGLLFPVTPLFSFSASASAEYVHQNGNTSPSPIIQIMGSMRFYFGFFDSKGSENSNEFKGWRYPFGNFNY